jgi:hypothetical protein
MDIRKLIERVRTMGASVREQALDRRLREEALRARTAKLAQDGGLQMGAHDSVLNQFVVRPQANEADEDEARFCRWESTGKEASSSRGLYSVEMFDLLDDLIERGEVRLEHLQRYVGSSRAPMQYRSAKGRQVPHEYSVYYLRWNDASVVLAVDGFDPGRDFWRVTITEHGNGFWKLLRDGMDDFFVRKHRGKYLDHAMQEMVVKTYRREDLIYPPELSRRVDQLFEAFRCWQLDPRVARWGALLIGPPGTGKTTVGGLLAGMKSPECTFVYAPAADIGDPGELVEIFRCAKLLSPCVLQIDDVDLISRDRGYYEGPSMTSVLMEQLDGLSEETRLFVILTTNDAKAIDKAIVKRAGRVSNKIVFRGFGACLPALLARHVASLGISLSDADIREAVAAIGEVADAFSPDEARNACERLLLSRETVTTAALTTALTDTFHAFHSEEADETYLS